MLYHILNYDPKSHIAKGIESSMYKGNQTSSGHVVSLICPNSHVEIGQTYSFVPHDEFIDTVFVRGILDDNNARSGS